MRSGNRHFLKRKIQRGKKLFRDFSGHTAEPLGEVAFPDNPQVALAFGELVAVEYETVRDGKLELYRHVFKKSARPLLTSSFDGHQLFILGGEYNFTERGIVDKPHS